MTCKKAKREYQSEINDFLTPKVDVEKSLMFGKIKFKEFRPKTNGSGEYRQRDLLGSVESMD